MKLKCNERETAWFEKTGDKRRLGLPVEPLARVEPLGELLEIGPALK